MYPARYGIFVRGGTAVVLGQEDREQLDILFLDISMDGTDGMETAEQIRDWKEEREEVLWGSLPLLIFVTGYPE